MKTKMIQNVHPVPKPLTEEQKTEQAARILAQKREQFFSIALSNFARATGDPKRAVDLALETADYAMQRLYNLPPMEDAK